MSKTEYPSLELVRCQNCERTTPRSESYRGNKSITVDLSKDPLDPESESVTLEEGPEMWFCSIPCWREYKYGEEE